jgi:hypothetical protein
MEDFRYKINRIAFHNVGTNVSNDTFFYIYSNGRLYIDTNIVENICNPINFNARNDTPLSQNAKSYISNQIKNQL